MENNELNFLHQLNAVGVIGHNFAVDAPFLTNPHSLESIDYVKLPIEIVNLKSFETLLDENDKQFIYEQLSHLFMASSSGYVKYQEDNFYSCLLTAENCINPILHGQYGLFTKKEIKKFQVLGFYSGIYLTSFVELEELFKKYNPITIARYGSACLKEGIPAICGHHNGNYMTIINDYRPFKWYDYDKEALEQIKAVRYNANTIVIRSGEYYFIAYLACNDIPADTELYTDYGDGYWEREKELYNIPKPEKY